MAEPGSEGDHQHTRTPTIAQDALELDYSLNTPQKPTVASDPVGSGVPTYPTVDSGEQQTVVESLSANVNPDYLSSSQLKDSPNAKEQSAGRTSPLPPVLSTQDTQLDADQSLEVTVRTEQQSGTPVSDTVQHADVALPDAAESPADDAVANKSPDDTGDSKNELVESPSVLTDVSSPSLDQDSSSISVVDPNSVSGAVPVEDSVPAANPAPTLDAAPPVDSVPAVDASPDVDPAQVINGVPASVETAADDSGCEVEPEPAAAMLEPRGPAMTDVEQLARSVVSDTLERAKQDAKLQRELEYSEKDPDTDDDGWLDIVGNGQLKKKVVRRGTGGREERPKRSQVVTVRQKVRLAASEAELPDPPEQLSFGLGDGEVVTGLDMAVGLMQPSETAQVYMEPRFAYGERGLEENGIPPNASLIFTITLEGIEEVPKYEEMDTQQRLQIGGQKRDRGNWWFKRDEFNHALQCYRRALDFFDNESEDFTGLPDDVHVLFEERLKVHNNMAAAQMKLDAQDAALRSLQVVLNCQPNNVKALYRKGKVLAAQGKLAESVEALRLALREDPDNRTVMTELNKVTERQKRAADEQKSLYRKMLGLPPGDVKPTPEINDKKFRMPIKLLVCGVVCGLAAVVVSRLRIF